jgi:hypothetical protein
MDIQKKIWGVSYTYISWYKKLPKPLPEALAGDLEDSDVLWTTKICRYERDKHPTKRTVHE